MVNLFHGATLIVGTLKLLGHVGWPRLWVLALAALSIAIDLVSSATPLAVFSRNWKRDEW